MANLLAYNGDIIGGGNLEGLAATKISYDNTTSQMTASNAQAAIDELCTNISGKVSKSGDTMTGRLNINQSTGNSGIWLGNDIPNGTTGASRGLVLLYGLNQYYGQIYDGNGITANRDYLLPDKSGTIALTSDIESYDRTTIENVTSIFDILDGAGTTYPDHSRLVAYADKLTNGSSTFASLFSVGNYAPFTIHIYDKWLIEITCFYNVFCCWSGNYNTTSLEFLKVTTAGNSKVTVTKVTS